MGCQISTDVKKNQLNEVLTEEQIRLVRSTWNVLADDMESTGVVILTRLLENEQSLRPLFLRLALDTRGRGYELEHVDKPKLRRHATVVMEALGAAVESLDDSVHLTNILRALGLTHANYSVTPDMLPKMWSAIDFGLEATLREQYSSNVRDAWRAVFSFLISKMKEGMQDFQLTQRERQRDELKEVDKRK